MERKECWYSVIRYCSDPTAGEIINVGLILHSSSDMHILRHRLLDENNVKIKGIANTKVDLDMYKISKEYIEYLLETTTSKLFIQDESQEEYNSAFERYYLHGLYKSLDGEKMFISEPTFAKTGDVDQLFDSLFATYVGSKFMIAEHRDSKHFVW